MEYRDVLSYFLKQAGMTPAELSRRIGSPRSTVAALLNSRAKEPKLSTAKAIADALGVELEDMVAMMYGEGEEE